jgi:anti-sigma regulatory factor (Ser/Thr protein kinase)
MEEPSININLEIPKDPDGILSYINQVLSALKEKIALEEGVVRNIKLILVELVTNSIKHSNDEHALIEVSINHPKLTIQKVDKGLQIQFCEDSHKIPFVDVNKTVMVSFSETKKHHIKILDKYQFKFLDAYKEGITIDYMPEHFGLYIITLASDSFVYQHDPKLQENRFIVDLRLRD